MLSKKDDDLLYAFALPADPEGMLLFRLTEDPFARPSVASDVEAGGVSPMGDEEAMASFTRSSLLNLAFADSKS